MGDFFELPPDRRVDFRMVVSVQVRPDGRVGIQIFTALRVAQHRAFAGYNEDRLAPPPIAHLRKRMPDVIAVELGKLVHVYGEPRVPGLRWESEATSWPASVDAVAVVTVHL